MSIRQDHLSSHLLPEYMFQLLCCPGDYFIWLCKINPQEWFHRWGGNSKPSSLSHCNSNLPLGPTQAACVSPALSPMCCKVCVCQHCCCSVDASSLGQCCTTGTRCWFSNPATASFRGVSGQDWGQGEVGLGGMPARGVGWSWAAAC